MIVPCRRSLLAVSLAFAAPVVAGAQARVDSSARAIVAAERDLNGRVVARTTVAVLPFAVHSADSTLAPVGFGFAALISDDLARSHRLTMVERLQLGDIQGEQQFQLTANVDQSTVVKQGRLIAAQHMVFGQIDALANGSIAINEQVVGVASGAIEVRPRSNTSLDALFRAERDLVMATFTGLGVKLTPDELRSLNERVAPNFQAFLAFSRGTRAEALGNDAEAVAAFQEAASLDKQFTLAQTKLAAARQRLSAHPAAAAATSTKAATDKEDVKETALEKDGKPVGETPIGASAPGGSVASSSASQTAAAKAKAAATAKPAARKATTHPRVAAP